MNLSDEINYKFTVAAGWHEAGQWIKANPKKACYTIREISEDLRSLSDRLEKIGQGVIDPRLKYIGDRMILTRNDLSAWAFRLKDIANRAKLGELVVSDWYFLAGGIWALDLIQAAGS
jgi:hypothetical protein